VAIRAELIQHDRTSVDLDRDRALVVRYQQGDEAAFDELYRRYYPRVHLYCQRRIGDRHAAEELAQEAFLRALRAMPRFAGERRFYPWMTVIAQRLCIDHHRRSSRVEPTSDIDPGSVEPDHDAIFAEVDHAMLSEALSRVAPRHREVLTLREKEGWSYLQIASYLDVPITTVEALLHRARKALRREFLAVSSGSRLASLPLIGVAFAGLARLRARFTGATGSGTGSSAAQLAPAAAAGLAALGLVLIPLAQGDDHSQTSTAASVPAAVSAPALETPAAMSDPVIVVLAPIAPPTTAAAAARADAPPPPSADLGVAQVYDGPAATDYWGQKIDEAPVHVNLDPIVKVGLDPVAALEQLIKGGK
jgi:RNA polymerase sigma-70 factor (ECF subfamily)